MFSNSFIKIWYTYVLDEPKLTDSAPTRFFINENHEAVEDLRNALRSVMQII